VERAVRKKANRLVVVGLLGLGLTGTAGGCATKTQTGLLVGGAGGAAAGAAIGSAGGNAGKGALIGGAIGLIGGGLIGHAADKSDEADRERQLREDEQRSRQYASRSAAPSRGARLSQDQVVTWTQAGTRDDLIIDRIERSDTVFRLTAADEQSLRREGVSDDVIYAMKDTARR
jgi:hypothetical protein